MKTKKTKQKPHKTNTGRCSLSSRSGSWALAEVGNQSHASEQTPGLYLCTAGMLLLRKRAALGYRSSG